MFRRPSISTSFAGVLAVSLALPARAAERYAAPLGLDVAAAAKSDAADRKPTAAPTIWSHTVVCDLASDPSPIMQTPCLPNDPGCSAVLEHAVPPSGRRDRAGTGVVPPANAADFAQQIMAHVYDNCRSPGRPKSDLRGFRPDLEVSLSQPDHASPQTSLDHRRPAVSASFGVTGYF